MEVNLERKKTLVILIMGLIVGLLSGVIITARFNFTPQIQATSQEVNNSLITLEDAFVAVAEEVGPAVVSISTESTEVVGDEFFSVPFGDSFFDEFFREFFCEIPRRKFKRLGIGSGVIVHK
ncbi:MAG: hypothetical protein AB7E08_04485, partial [Candidatus Omnitrophota bacterium]